MDSPFGNVMIVFFEKRGGLRAANVDYVVESFLDSVWILCCDERVRSRRLWRWATTGVEFIVGVYLAFDSKDICTNQSQS